MVILIGVLAFVMFVVFSKLSSKDDKKELYAVIVFISGISLLIIIFIVCFFMIPKLGTAFIIDDKIAMYQEANAIIEQNIDNIVSEYLKYEQDTFTKLKPEESAITLVTVFPELKSNTLVQQQLEIYVANNQKIRRLREEKIDISKTKWLLYFGK